MATLDELMAGPAPAKSLDDLIASPPDADPLAPKMGYVDTLKNGALGWMARTAQRLPGAVGNAATGAMQLPGRAVAGVEGAVRGPQPAMNDLASLLKSDAPTQYDYASPGGAQAAGAPPEQNIQDTLYQQAVQQAQTRVAGAQEGAATYGASAVRDLALSGLIASGAGTPVGVAATVGFPAVTEATGMDKAVSRLGTNAAGALKSIEPDNYYLGKVADIAGETVQQAPTLAALGLGAVAAVGGRTIEPARAGVVQALIDAGVPQDKLPQIRKSLYDRTVGAGYDNTLGVNAPELGFLNPANLIPESVKSKSVQALRGPLKNLNALNLLDLVTPEKIGNAFRGDLANLKRYAPGVGEAAQTRKDTLNLVNKDAQALSDEIRNTLSEAEQKRLAQLAEGLPARRLARDGEPALDLSNTPAYNARFSGYYNQAKTDVAANSPGLRPELQDLTARAIATSRTYEDAGFGADGAYKTWGNYKPTAAEIAPLNRLEQDLRGADYADQKPVPFEEGAAQLRAQNAQAPQEPGLLPQGGLSVPGEEPTTKRLGPSFDPDVAKAIVQKFDPNTELNSQSSRLEAHQTVKDVLKRIYTERPGYIKHMYVEKMSDAISDVMGAERGMNWATKSPVKENRAGATQRQDPSLTAGLTRVKTAAEPLSTAIRQNGAYSAAKSFNEALAGTPFVKEAVSAAEEKAGWHKLGDSKENGPLAGKWVDPKLWSQLQDSQSAEGLGKSIRHLTDWWSRNNAVGKISGNLMNFAGAHLANDMTLGIPLWEAPAVVKKGLGAYASQYATDVKRLGTSTLSAGDAKQLRYMEAELAPVKAAADELEASRRPTVAHLTGAVDMATAMLKGTLKYLMTEEGASVVDPQSMAKFFQLVETVNRNGTYVHLRDKGFSHAEARDLMNKAQVDYTDPSAVVKVGRNFGLGGVGNRFAQFGLAQTANLLETAGNANPLIAARTWKYPLLSQAWNGMMQKVNGESEKDRKLRLDLAKVYDTFPASTFIFDMPRNPEGLVQSANFGRANPAGWATSMLTGMNAVAKGDPEGGKLAVGSLGGLSPAISPIINIMNRYDPFYGRDPLPGGTSTLSPVGVARSANYLASKLLPESVGSFPSSMAQLQRMQDNPMATALRGKRVNPDELMVRNILGVRVGHFDPQMEKYTQAQKIKSEMSQASPSANLRGDVTQREALDLTKEHLRNARRLGRPLQEYAK